MPKSAIKSKAAPDYMSQPWACVHHKDHSEITIFTPSTGNNDVVAETHTTPHHTAEALAEFIVQAINAYDKREHLINEMSAALELCLECDGPLNWEAEHDADIVIRRAKARN